MSVWVFTWRVSIPHTITVGSAPRGTTTNASRSGSETWVMRCVPAKYETFWYDETTMPSRLRRSMISCSRASRGPVLTRLLVIPLLKLPVGGPISQRAATRPAPVCRPAAAFPVAVRRLGANPLHVVELLQDPGLDQVLVLRREGQKLHFVVRRVVGVDVRLRQHQLRARRQRRNLDPVLDRHRLGGDELGPQVEERGSFAQPRRVGARVGETVRRRAEAARQHVVLPACFGERTQRPLRAVAVGPVEKDVVRGGDRGQLVLGVLVRALDRALAFELETLLVADDRRLGVELVRSQR